MRSTSHGHVYKQCPWHEFFDPILQPSNWGLSGPRKTECRKVGERAIKEKVEKDAEAEPQRETYLQHSATSWFCPILYTVRDELVREHAFSDYSWGWQYDANCVTPLCESNTAKTSKTARGDNALWTRVNRIEMKRVAHGLSWPKWCKSSLHSLKVLKYVTVTVHRFGPCLIDLGWAWLVLQGLKSQAPLLI